VYLVGGKGAQPEVPLGNGEAMRFSDCEGPVLNVALTFAEADKGPLLLQVCVDLRIAQAERNRSLASARDNHGHLWPHGPLHFPDARKRPRRGEDVQLCGLHLQVRHGNETRLLQMAERWLDASAARYKQGGDRVFLKQQAVKSKMQEQATTPLAEYANTLAQSVAISSVVHVHTSLPDDTLRCMNVSTAQQQTRCTGKTQEMTVSRDSLDAS
jgi:hypothetical protein